MLISGVKMVDILTFFNVGMGVVYQNSRPRRGYLGAKREKKSVNFG